MSHYEKQKQAAAKVAEMIERPMPEGKDYLGESGNFDPWELFPIFGNYSSEFDQMAIEVLREIKTSDKKRSDLGAEMFREMLCKLELCDYGSSPRVCFATLEFKALLPRLIERWREFGYISWGARF